MKATYTFDPYAKDYGPATSAIRRVFEEWADVDWFVPSDADAADRGRMLFTDHHALACHHASDLFAHDLDLTCCRGGWNLFVAICKRVRESPGWDWKFAGLKSLGTRHAKARGWSRDEHPACGWPPEPGDLFARIGQMTICLLGFPKRDFAALEPEQAEWASWYVSFADMELLESIEWQLAEASSELTGNPFVPLLHCYAAGTYPFSLGKNQMLLFSFER
jgi:hypothetical protein